MEYSKKHLVHMSILTLMGMSALGMLIIYIFQEELVLDYIFNGLSVQEQAQWGLLYGAAAALIGVTMLHISPMESFRDFFADFVQEIDPKLHHIVFFSLCAAVGEEILFRAAIQPFLGIWITAFLFVLLHGYISFKSPHKLLFSVVLTAIVAGLGYLYQQVGLGAAIVAHFTYDVVLFAYLKNVATSTATQD